MKKFMKFMLFGFLALVVLIVIVAVAGGGSDEPLETNDAQPATAQPEKKEEPKEENKITKENYDAITSGDTMTGEGGTPQQEVLDMLGEESSQMEVDGGEYKSVTYTWMDDELRSITVTFTNDKVSSKLWSE